MLMIMTNNTEIKDGVYGPKTLETFAEFGAYASKLRMIATYGLDTISKFCKESDVLHDLYGIDDSSNGTRQNH